MGGGGMPELIMRGLSFSPDPAPTSSSSSSSSPSNRPNSGKWLVSGFIIGLIVGGVIGFAYTTYAGNRVTTPEAAPTPQGQRAPSNRSDPRAAEQRRQNQQPPPASEETDNPTDQQTDP